MRQWRAVLARFVQEQGLTTQREIRVETQSGLITPRLEDNGEVTVDMGAPRFAPADIPFVSESDAVVHSLVKGECETVRKDRHFRAVDDRIDERRDFREDLGLRCSTDV